MGKRSSGLKLGRSAGCSGGGGGASGAAELVPPRLGVGRGRAEMEMAEVRATPWRTDQRGQGTAGTLPLTEEFVSTGVEKEGR